MCGEFYLHDPKLSTGETELVSMGESILKRAVFKYIEV